ncbi:hypothetical protein TNCV_4534601 [Trichonephila clavipes]|nr:hypothetical protein TNCV_4534601 [Trichonephila clavipes]
MLTKSAELRVLPLVWCDSLERRVAGRVSSSSLAGGSELRVAFLLLYTTRGLLAMDLVILNYGQVMRKTPELHPLSPNFHMTPTRGRLRPDRFKHALAPLHGKS